MEQHKDEATCFASVCARLETSISGSSEEHSVHCQAAHQDVAAVSAGLQIAIIDVGTASVVAVLGGVHAASIVQIAWAPDNGSYGTSDSNGQRLASVDKSAKAVVWDVAAASPLTVCSVIADRRKQPQQAAVVDMAWGSSARDALLVLLQPATLVVINAETGAIVRSVALAQGLVMTSLTVDEWDPSVFATSTMSSALITCRLEDPVPPPGHQAAAPSPSSQIATTQHNLPMQGNGLVQVRWAANRSILLIMQPYQLLVYDIDSKAVLSRTELPQRYTPFVRWLGVEGTGACLGTGDDGGCNTLICEHDCGFVSVWHDADGLLQYTLHAFHRLLPHIKSEALGLQANMVALVPSVPRFAMDQPPANTPLLSAPSMMWVTAIMSNGQLWRWRVPLPTSQVNADGSADLAAAEARRAAAQVDLIKLSSAEVVEGDSRAFLAHSRSLSRRSIRSRENSYSQLPIVGREPSMAASDASGSLLSAQASLPPRKFLVDGRRSIRHEGDDGDGSAPVLPHIASAASVKSGQGPLVRMSSTPELAASDPSHPAQPPSGGEPPLAPAQSIAAPGSEPASLEVLSSALTASASSLSVFPVLVPRGDVQVLSRNSARANPGELPAAVAGLAAMDAGAPLMDDSAELLHIDGNGGTDCVSLVAVGTVDGSIEVLTVSQGALQPLSFNATSTFKVGTTKILSVHWMGSTLRFAAMTCTAMGKPENQKFSYMVTVTDVVTARTVTLLREEEAPEPLVALRACPHGRYLAIMPRAGGLQVWCVPIMGKAVKVRTVELPFVAMAWVHSTPQEVGHSPIFRAEMEAAAWPAHYKRVSSGRASNSKGIKEEASGSGTQAAFCFAVSDGRLGSITVTDRGVKKRPVTAPHWTVTYVDRLVVTSIAAMGDLVFIGDSDGILYQWNTASGKTMVVPAGMKVIRKISLGPPGSAALDLQGNTQPDAARLVLLYGDGSLGVWNVTDELTLEGGRCDSLGKEKLARYTDAAWVPLPSPLTGGCICAAIGKNSGAVLLDLMDKSGAQKDVRERHVALGKLVRGERDVKGSRLFMPMDSDAALRASRAVLAPPRPCHSLRLLPSAVITFLRLILESGVPLTTLQSMGSQDGEVSTKAAQSLCCFLMDIPEDGEEAEAFTATLGATGRLPLLPDDGGATMKLQTPDTFDPQAVLQAVDLSALCVLVARVAMRRTGDPMSLLLPHEVAAYSAAVATKRTRERRCRCMAFTAALFGCIAETRFWSHLHASLSAHTARDSRTARPPSGAASPTLYPRAAAVSEAQQRVRWHEQTPSDLPQDWVELGPNPLQDRRMLEYVSIGDYASAAALMMGEAPAVNNMFYRNAVLMIALAGGTAGGGSARPSASEAGPFIGKALADTAAGGRGFQVQALKVVAEHARDIGDSVLCIVLLCAAGRWLEAVAELQAMDDWRSALSLAEHSLTEPERNALLHAWAKAQHVEHVRPDVVWRTAGLYTAAGSLRSAAAALRGSGLSAAASSFTRICSEMGLVCSVGAGSALEGLLPAAMRSKIEAAVSRSRMDAGGLFGPNGALRGRGTPALGWVTREGRWCKEGKGPTGRDGLDPEEMVLVNFDAPDTVVEDGVRRMSGETIVDEDRVGWMLSDQRQHVLYVLMEVCKGDVW